MLTFHFRHITMIPASTPNKICWFPITIISLLPKKRNNSNKSIGWLTGWLAASLTASPSASVWQCSRRAVWARWLNGWMAGSLNSWLGR